LLLQNAWLNEALGKVVKVVAPLLSHLDPKYEYRVIYMERDLEEIVRSQNRMLERLGKVGARRSPEDLKKMLKNQDVQARSLMAQHPRIESLVISHRETIANPSSVAEKIIRFVDADGALDSNTCEMAAAIRPELHREKGES